MLKCKVIQGFSSTYHAGAAGEVIELPNKEAENFQSCGFVEILPDDEQDPMPMAYETAKEAIKAETAKPKQTAKRK